VRHRSQLPGVFFAPGGWCCARQVGGVCVNLDLIIFDWGGTLVSVAAQPEALYRGARAVCDTLLGRSDESLVRALAETALRAEAAAAADGRHREVNLAALLADWAAAHGQRPGKSQLERAVRAVGEHWLNAGLQPYPGAREAVRILHDAGYRLGLVSNVMIPPDYCRRELEREGFADVLDFAVFSSQVGYRKPSRAIYEAALAAAFPEGPPADLSRVLFVGDSPSCDVMAPAALGMKTALVASSPGTWPEADLAAARPDLRIGSVRELPRCLKIG